MRNYYTAAGIVIAFFALVLIAAFVRSKGFPALAISGEASVGTWLSGVLLVICATLCLVFGMRRGWMPWYILTLFFLALAADERFMFHEGIKERIIFATKVRGSLMAELPVIIGALVGFGVMFMLWNRLHRTGRVLLVGAVVLGSASVVFDVFHMGAAWEDSFKLFAELLVVCALLREV